MFRKLACHSIRSSGVCSISSRAMGTPHLRRKEKEDTTEIKSRETLLNSRNALVTNCDVNHGELPRNVAIALASYGANVIVHGENESNLSSILSSLPVVHAGQQHAFLVDKLTEGLDVDLGEKIRPITNALDVVIHNTGSLEIPKSKDVSECPVTEFDGVVRQSLTTPFALFQSLYPLIAAGKNPSVVFCSTTAEHEEDTEGKEPHDNAYYVSKFTFNSSRMLTKMLAETMAKKGIRVNAVDPGRFLSHDNEALALGNKSSFAKTSAFVWLARSDTEMSGAQIDATEWIRRDPMMFKSFY